MADAAAVGRKVAEAKVGSESCQLGGFPPWAAFEQLVRFSGGSLLAAGENRCSHGHAVAGGCLHPGLAGVDRPGGQLLPRVVGGGEKSPVVG